MNKQQEPRLRFKGFTGAWEEKKLGDMADIVRGASPRPIQDPKWFDDSSDIGWLRISDVTTQNGRIHYLEQKISKAGQEKTRVIETPHLLLSIAASVGKPVINYVKTGVHDGFLVFKNPNFELEFMFQYLDSFVDTWQSYGQPGTQVNLNSNIVKNTEFLVPTLPEQTHLGLFFRRLDSQIAESRAVLEKSRQLKKTMLAKMFPANGEKIPKIRFKGFDGEWECRKLGDLMNVTSVKRIHQSDWTNEGVRFLRARDIVAFNKGEKIEEPLFISKEKYNEYSELSGKVKIGDLLVTGVGTIGVPYLIEDEDPLYFKDGNVIWFQNENKIGGLFFYYSFLNNFIQDFIIETAGIGTVGTYTIDTGKKTPIFLPPTKSEQTAIGLFFRQLDETIALQSAEVEKLNQLKKGLLAAMLV